MRSRSLAMRRPSTRGTCGDRAACAHARAPVARRPTRRARWRPSCRARTSSSRTRSNPWTSRCCRSASASGGRRVLATARKARSRPRRSSTLAAAPWMPHRSATTTRTAPATTSRRLPGSRPPGATQATTRTSYWAPVAPAAADTARRCPRGTLCAVAHEGRRSVVLLVAKVVFEVARVSVYRKIACQVLQRPCPRHATPASTLPSPPLSPTSAPATPSWPRAPCAGTRGTRHPRPRTRRRRAARRSRSCAHPRTCNHHAHTRERLVSSPFGSQAPGRRAGCARASSAAGRRGSCRSRPTGGIAVRSPVKPRARAEKRAETARTKAAVHT
jgi:hypothetical protein